MAVKTIFLKEDFKGILSNYDLGEYKKSKPLAKGTVQTNYLLYTTKGKFVFRYYENRSKNSVLFEAYLIRYLKDKNYPCPNIFKNKSNEFVGVYEGKPYAIFEFVEGKHIKNPNKKQKRELIKRVAELQNLTKNYKPYNKESRWNYGIELCKELAQKEEEKIGGANSKKKLKWLENELSKLNIPNSLPKGICHCDFHFSNVLFRGSKFKALIDFDDANYTFLIFDLANLINPFVKSFEWDTWHNFNKNESILNFNEAKKIVLEYMKYRQLNEEEKQHLFDVFKLSILLDCVWYFARGNAEDFYEKRKIGALDILGREEFYKKIFR